MHWRFRRPAAGLLPVAIFLLSATPLHAQSEAFVPGYDSVYRDLVGLTPVRGQAAQVRDLVIQRDVGRLELTEGHLVLLSPVGGRTVAVAFQGQGLFRFAPPTRMEQGRLREFKDVTELAEPFTDLILIFCDSTLQELRSRVTFGEGPIPDDVERRVDRMMTYLGEKDDRTLDPDMLRPLLNRETNALFYAYMVRDGDDPWMFMVNPYETESVRLMVRARHSGYTRLAEVVSQFPAGGDTVPRSPASERVKEARVAQYDIESWLTHGMTGDLSFSAAARLEITSDTAVGPWIAFALMPKIIVDSARWHDTGEPAVIFKGKDDYYLWVRLRQTIAPGTTETLRLYYHGDLIDRYGDWFFIKSSVAWYPQQLGWRDVANFNLTFHYPASMTLAAVGDQTSLTREDRMVTSTWATSHPIRNASFNLGIFETHVVEEDGSPKVSVLWSEEGHEEIGRVMLSVGEVVQERNMKERVGLDVAAAMQFFGEVFGPPSVNHFYATEIPYLHGEAFPGLIHLSYATFVLTSRDGGDEVFRAHEVAHQWWGIGVDYASYHDQWLSEGISDFAGLWFMQTRRKDNDKYFEMLERWRTDILARRGDSLPIWLGRRMDTGDRRDRNYNVIVYQKGAWVIHMLRILLLDLPTMNEDRFGSVMREFYQSYKGQRASTADFQHVLERRLGQPMGWFFNQWVYGHEIPTYRVAWKSETDGNGKYRLQLRVRQEDVAPDFLMYVPVKVVMEDESVVRARVKITGEVSELTLPVLLPSRPESLEFNDMHGVLAEVKTEEW